ncbi:MAG: ADP-glyceromanno-heptose 6-epimerase [Verrucomicrobiota bacterium]|nr:ADP-glyceromanno-heptose 6-epimerase [Verrucomicrobiota bacterium]
MKKPLIVVTGAAGMIGSGVVRYLNDCGTSDLLLVDDLKSGEKWKNLLGKSFVDLISKHQLHAWLQGRQDEVGAIVHLGACSDTVETNVDYLMENNFHYTVRLAEWALKHDKRFVYASSAATYGDGSAGFSDEMIEELRPLNPYGFSKQLVDLWMKREGVLGQVVGLKYFNVFGPNEYHKGRMASMVLKMTGKAAQEGRIQLYKSNDQTYEDGGQCRDFIYVKDAVAMTCAFLERRDVGGLFNIGRGRTTTWNVLAAALFDALEREKKVEYIEMPPELSKQYQNYTCADMRKFHKIFSEFSTVSIEDAVKEYVREYLLKNARW